MGSQSVHSRYIHPMVWSATALQCWLKFRADCMGINQCIHIRLRWICSCLTILLFHGFIIENRSRVLRTISSIAKWIMVLRLQTDNCCSVVYLLGYQNPDFAKHPHLLLLWALSDNMQAVPSCTLVNKRPYVTRVMLKISSSVRHQNVGWIV